jgi:hypothetical protein
LVKEGRSHAKMKEIDEAMKNHPQLAATISNINKMRKRDKVRVFVNQALKTSHKRK